MESVQEIAARFAAKKGNLMLDLYPVTKLTFVLCMLLASICSPHWCFGFIVFVVCGILTAYAGKLKDYLKGMRIILILFVGLLTFSYVLGGCFCGTRDGLHRAGHYLSASYDD